MPESMCPNCVWAGEVEVCGTCNGPKDDNTLFAARRSVGTTVAFSERDPNGIAANQAGAKLDAGKNRLGLVLCGFSRALQEVAKVGTILDEPIGHLHRRERTGSFGLRRHVGFVLNRRKLAHVLNSS